VDGCNRFVRCHPKNSHADQARRYNVNQYEDIGIYFRRMLPTQVPSQKSFRTDRLLSMQAMQVRSNFNFTNSGIYLYHEGNNEPINMLCVCGIARGGTTAVAAGLEQAGIPMSLKKNLTSVKEDLDFHSAVESEDCLKNYIEKRVIAAKGKIAGCKYPGAYNFLSNFAEISNIALIIVLRDPLAVAMRNTSSMLIPMDSSLDSAIDSYRQIINNVKSSVNTSFLPKIILLSYEKLLASPQETFQNLYEMCNFDQKFIQEASLKSSSAVTLDPTTYLSESNIITDYCIELLSETTIKGNIYTKISIPNITLDLKFKHSRTYSYEFIVNDCAAVFSIDLSEFALTDKSNKNQDLSLRIQDTEHFLVKGGKACNKQLDQNASNGLRSKLSKTLQTLRKKKNFLQ